MCREEKGPWLSTDLGREKLLTGRLCNCLQSWEYKHIRGCLPADPSSEHLCYSQSD